METELLGTENKAYWALKNKTLEELIDIFEKVNIENMREACIEAINEKALLLVETEKGSRVNNEEAILRVSSWYVSSVMQVLESLYSDTCSFPYSETTTLLILVRGAFRLDEERRKRFKIDYNTQEHLKAGEHRACGHSCMPDNSNNPELIRWEEAFSRPVMNLFCRWISDTIFLTAWPDSSESWEMREQCFVVLRGALKYERRRYRPAVRELLLTILETADHKHDSDLPRKLQAASWRKEKMDPILTRIFKIIAETGDKNLLPAVERNAPAPEDILKFAQMAIESSPEMRKEEARWLAINALRAS